MGHRRTNHRPLRAGIGVTPNLGIPGYGTLTGIARRNSDGVLVAVTNLHVVSDGVDGNGNPSTYYVDEQDSLHQWDAAQSGSRIGNLYANTENGPVTSFIPVGSGDGASLGDVAAVELATGVSATFDVHVHVPGTNNHRQVPIVAGTIDPVYVPNPEEWEREFLTLFGATTGEHAVEVTSHHDPENIDIAVFSLRAADERLYSFQNVFRLDRSDPPSEAGDSGAPLLKMDEYGNFRMSAIYFAAKRPSYYDPYTQGYCFPASVAERELGINFGTQMPTADAGDSFDVVAGGAIELNGSGSRSNETGGDPLSYTWVLENATGGVNLATYNPLLTLPPPHSAEMSIPAPSKPAFLTFKLIVTDRFGAKHFDRVHVTVVNNPPTANPGYTQAVAAGSTVTLDGSRSSDPDGHSLTYRWEQLGLGELGIAPVTPVTISNSNQATATFVAPNQAGPLSFKLTVTDPGDLTHSANVTIHACSATGESRWYDTRETRCHNNARQKHQTQVKDGMTEFQWVADPDNEEWGAWQDTSASHRNEEPGDWRDSGRPTYALGNTWQTQERTVTFDKQQTRTSHCNNMQTQWNPATKTERRRVFGSGWPISRPPTPTGSQWTVRHLDNKLQVKVTSLPTVTSSIIEVRARLEGGSTSDRAKVIKPIGTTLNTWVTVLSSSDDRWREGAWVAKIRFENSEKNSNYSTTKSVTAPTTPTTPVTPPITPAVTPPLPPPTNVSATATARSVTVSWSAVSDATGYVVEIGIPPSAGGLSHTSDPTTGTSITISNLLPWTTYEYRVKATAEGRIGTWSGWATVVTPKEDPLTPTNDQWDIEYDSDNNKIQAKVISLPAVIPAISEARVSMEIGQPPNPVTVTKAIGVSLGTWVDVLTSADTEWQSGTWAAHLRFENSVGNSSYSLPAKPVIVPTVPTTPPPIIDPDPWLDWTDALPPNNTRNEVIDAWTDTGNQRENQVLLIMEKEQTRTITWEKRQERTSQSGNRTESRWVDASRTETQWVEIPPPCTWVDVSPARYQGCGPSREKQQQCTSHGSTETRWVDASEPLVWTAFADVYPAVTRNRVEGQWRDTGNQRENQILLIFEKEQTLTTTWEKKQISTNQCSTTPREHWADASSTQTRWRIIPEVCGSWSDTGQTRVDRYGSWSRTGRTRGSGANKECQERRTVYREKQQSCTTNAPYNNTRYRWVSTSSTTATQWVDCPEEEWPSTWTDTGSIENFDAGTWRDLSTTQDCGPDRERKQIRIATWRKEQFQTSNLGNRRTRWVSASRISFQWRDYPEPLRWSSWTDTGVRHRENHEFDYSVEKEQERTSHCGDTQTRWVYVSG